MTKRVRLEIIKEMLERMKKYASKTKLGRMNLYHHFPINLVPLNSEEARRVKESLSTRGFFFTEEDGRLFATGGFILPIPPRRRIPYSSHPKNSEYECRRY